MTRFFTVHIEYGAYRHCKPTSAKVGPCPQPRCGGLFDLFELVLDGAVENSLSTQVLLQQNKNNFIGKRCHSIDKRCHSARVCIFDKVCQAQI